MSQPVISSDRLRLEPLADGHLEHEVALDADPAVMRFLADGRPRTRDEVVALHPGRMARASDGLGFWVGFFDEAFVGWWILSRSEPGQASLGYRLLPRWWRQGLASEGSTALLRYGFENCGLTRVTAETMAVNAASRATMSSVGMRHVRSFHEEFEVMIPGSEHGEVEYAITRQEWARLR